MNRKTCLYRFLTVATLFICSMQLAAQCINSWSFKNVTEIPSICSQPWSENGITMEMIETTAANSCGTGSGCVFSIIENAPNQYNYLNILSGALEITIPDPANFYDLKFLLNEGLNACQIVRYFDGSNMVFEETVSSNVYQSNPATTNGLTFDKIQIAVIATNLFGFELKYICDDAAPAASPNIGFESLAQGTYGGTGASGPFLNLQGVDLFVSNEQGDMLPPSAAQYFIEDTRIATFGHGDNYFWPLHPVKFDFSNIPDDVITVFFDVASLEFDAVLKINDNDAFIGQLDFAPTNIAPGFTLTNLGSLGNTSGTRFMIEGGAIETLVLGGLEFFLDNISIVQGQAAVCDVTSLVLTNQDCNSDGTFDLDFFMNVDDVPGNSFSYFLDGQLLGIQNLSGTNNYSISNIVGTTDTEHTFSVSIDGSTDCGAEFDFYTPNCNNQSCLSFELDTTYSGGAGNSPGDMVTLLSMDGTVATVQDYYLADSINNSFGSLAVGTFQDDFIYGEGINLDLNFAAVNGTVNSITFQLSNVNFLYLGLNNEYRWMESQNDIPANLPAGYSAFNFGDYWTIEGPDIQHFSHGGLNHILRDICYTIAAPTCAMSNATIVNQECVNDQEFFAEFNFDHTGNTDSFSLISNRGDDFGNFAYTELPVTVGPFIGDGVINYTLIAEDLLTNNCTIESFDFGELQCNIPCSLSAPEFTILENCDENGLVSVEINLAHEGTADSFSVVRNLEILGNFSYDDLPLTIDGLDGFNQIENEIWINDTENVGCFLAIEVGFIDCSFVCGLNEFFVQNQICNADETVDFDLLLIFEPQPDSFELFLNGNSIGRYETNNTYNYQIENAPVLSQQENFLSACNLDGPQCCQTYRFDGIECPVPVCEITTLFLQNQDCNADGTVDLDFYMAQNNAPSSSFTYFLNGVEIATENIDPSQQYSVENLPVNQNAENTFSVSINGSNNDCFDEIVFYVPDCAGSNCLEFDGPNNYGGLLDGNVPGDTVAMLSIDGTVATVQTHYYPDLNSPSFQRLTIRENESDLHNPESINLDLDFSGVSGVINSINFRTIAGCCIYFGLNNEYYFLETIDDLPNVLPAGFSTFSSNGYWQIEGPEITHLSFGGGNIEFGDICYTLADPTCLMSNATIEILDCDNTKEYYVDFNFDYSGNTDSFFVQTNNINFGNFAYADLPITVGPFEGDGSNTYQLLAVDLLNICEIDTEVFGAIDCDPCVPGSLEILENFCDDNGPFIFFNYDSNGATGLWTYSVNGVLMDTLALFPSGSMDEFISSDFDFQDFNNIIEAWMIDAPNCTTTLSFDLNDCNNCQIDELAIEVTDCMDDLYYIVEVSMNAAPQSSPYLVSLNGVNQGQYDYSEFPISLNGDFSGNMEEEIVVTNISNPLCTASSTFQVSDCPTVCQLGNPTFNLTDCDAFARFSAVIDFDYGDLTGGFVVYQNGIFVGNYEYTDLPITRQGFEGDGETENTIVIVAQGNIDCTLTIDIGIVDCDVQCALLEFFVFDQTCNSDGTANITFAMVPVNTNSTSFDLTLNGAPIGTYDVTSDFQYTVENLSLIDGAINELGACMVDGPVCCETSTFTAIECTSSPCDIAGLTVSDQTCDGVPYGNIFFEVENPNNDFWEWWINGEYQGIENLSSDNNYWVNLADANPDALNTLQVCINDQPDCCQTIDFQVLDCTPECSIGGMEIEINDCSADGAFSVTLDFLNENTSDQFVLFGNGQTYGTYNYSDLPVTIDGFIGDASTVYELIASDINDDFCTAEIGFGPVTCPVINCSVEGLTLSDLTCDGVPYGNIFFEVENPNNDFWEWWINGEYQGIENLSPDNNYWVNLADANPDALNTLQVCINDQPDCCTTIEFEVPDCTLECSISDLDVVINDCSADGVFSVTLDFLYENTSDQFTLVGNGQDYGTFNYADLPVTIDGFIGDASTIYELLAIDINDSDCGNEVLFGPITCPVINCSIEGLAFENLSCDGQELFGEIVFEHTNATNDLAEYWVNNEYQGTFLLSSSNSYGLLLNSTNPGIINTLQVCINDQPDCCQTIEFQAPDCSSDCSISGMEIEINDCSADGVFSVTLDFLYENTSDQFTLVGNGQDYGIFNYSDLPVTIDGFVGDASTIYELLASDINGNGCSSETIFGPVTCPIGDCVVEILGLSNIECDGDIPFGVLDLAIENPGNNFFEYWINGAYVGVEELNSTNSYTISLEEADPTLLNMIQVCINDQPDCCSTFAFEVPDCTTSDCLIENLGLSGIDCLQDGTRGVTIFFEYNYPSSELFEVFIDGVSYDQYSYAKIPLTLLHIPPTTNGSAVVSVNPVGLPECELMGLVGLAPCPEIYCMDFEQIPADLDLTSNDIANLPMFLFEQEGVQVSIENCGADNFFRAETRINDGCPVVGLNQHALFLEGGALNYDFNMLAVAPNSITFEYCGEGELIVNNDTPIEFGNQVDGQTFSQNGYLVQSWMMSAAPSQGYVTISGAPINNLFLCGLETTFGPICYEVISTPSGDECYGFENLMDGGYFPIGSIDPVIYETSDFKVSLVDDIYNNGFLGVSSTPVAPPFNGAIGNFAVLRGGLEFNFSQLSEPTEFLSFEFSGESFAVSVNNEPEVIIDGFNPTDSLIAIGNGVVMYYSRENSNIWEGEVNFFGAIETLLITSEEIKLDNICYFLEIQGADVWPGDINSDNIADHCDVLYLGIANGAMGPERASQTEDWNGQFADDWDGLFEFENTNFKHADANGDGVVDENDLEVLQSNLGKVHGPLPAWNGIVGTEQDPPLFVDLNSAGPLISGGAFSVPIILGTSDLPVEDIYGLAFSIVFDTDEMNLSNTSISVNNSWLGNDIWKVEDMDIAAGRVNIGMTRTGLIDTTGYGEIGSFTGIIEDLVGKIINVGITDIKALSHDESLIPIFGQGTEGSVTTNTEKDALEDGLHVFPIPTSNNLHIRNYNEDDLSGIKIYNVLGQMMMIDLDPSNINLYDLEDYVSGIYFVEMELKGTSVVRKIEVLK